MSDLSPEPIKKKRGREAPRVEPERRRRRGAQPGNLNAIKHGLYIEGRSLRNTTPIERAQLFDLNEIITHIKHYINLTYQKGLSNKTIDEYNITLRSMALAASGLSRLIDQHNELQNSSLPSEFVVTKKTTVMSLVDHYKNKTTSLIDLSEVESDLQSPSPNSSLERG